MKLIVVNKMLEQKHRDRIRQVASELGVDAVFYEDEADIPQSDYDADIIYGFAPAFRRRKATPSCRSR